MADSPTFDPGRYTKAPHRTEGWIDFAGRPEIGFARVADHGALSDWVPLVSDVSVAHPKPVPPGESTVGTTRSITFKGGLSVVETVVHWDPPRCYAYTSKGQHWPLEDYLGVFLVVPSGAQGGRLIFREYFNKMSRAEEAILPHGVVALGERALGNLARSIGGLEYAMTKVNQV